MENWEFDSTSDRLKLPKVKLFSILGITLTLLTIGLGAFDYYLWQNSPIIIGDIVGWLITISLLWNTVFFSYIGRQSNLDTKEGYILGFFIDLYLFISLGTLVCLFLFATGQIWGIFVLAGYLLLSLIYYIVVLSILKDNDERKSILPWMGLFNENTNPNKRKFLLVLIKFIFILVVIVLYIACGILAHAQITGGDRLFGQVTGAGAGIATGFVVLIVVYITNISCKFLSRYSYKSLFWLCFLIGIITIPIFSLPLIYRNSSIVDMNSQFSQIYGSNWNEFPEEIQNQFLKEPFIGSQFYFGYGWDRLNTSMEQVYGVKKNILYSETPDYQLYYDIHYPMKGRAGVNSMGKNTTIILLHSGGWNDGDKGVDAQQMVAYLAARGYVIFDIQYRLLDSGLIDTSADFGFDLGWVAPDPKPYNNLRGDFSIRDMVYDFGQFTKHLASLTIEDRFGADLDSVVIMGVSAGGHIAAISTYGYNHPFFAGNFSSSLNIKAAVFFNPPNDAEYFFYEGHPMYFPHLINGTPDEVPELYYHYTPSNLINESSVPTILFHGTIDKMVPPENSDQIYTSLISHGCDALLFKGKFGGHGFDFGPYFAPVSGYYVERFLYHTLK